MSSELQHIGTKYHSGRFPYGSGKNPGQHDGELLTRANALRAEGKSDGEIAKVLNISSGDIRQMRSAAKDAKIAEEYRMWSEWRDKGLSITNIANRAGVPWSTVKNRLERGESVRASKIDAGMDMLKEAVNEKKYIDVGPGTAERIGLNKSRLDTAVKRLTETGEYNKLVIPIKQMNTGKNTNVSVLIKVDGRTEKEQWRDAFVAAQNNEIRLVDGYQESATRTVRNLEPPVNIDGKRVQVRYAEDGGKDMDGIIQLRRNVDDISLGKANYAQVRIAVDGTHYLKGMAMYSDNMPKGVDIVFNTNKTKDVPKMGPKDNTVLKPLKDDPENPFGATIKPSEQLVKAQRHYIGKDGKQHQSAINIVNEEGDWSNWSKTLSSQFLSKQPKDMVKKQLTLTLDDKKAEFEELKSITNPTVKKVLLDKFAESCDYDSVHLKAAALPRQASHVLIPVPEIKPNEIYAPNYRNGESVVLIRYPHGGKFEIPQLKVNNITKVAKKTVGNAPDAIGIHPRVAEQLSGADFDGDTALVIPVNSRVKVEHQKPLADLANFEPKEVYKGYDGMKRMTKGQTQTEMGKVSNLITDMTIKGATDKELARAVRHSMVVIDAEKHGLDYRASYKDNDIAGLKRKYQQKEDGKFGGASTIISRAKSVEYVPERKDYVKVDPKTGEKIYGYTGRTKLEKVNGDWVQSTTLKQQKSTKMAETKDARTLMSNNPAANERLYADFANNLKAMANKARLESMRTPNLQRSATAAETYAKEVASLNNKMKDTMKRKPLERQAQMIATNTVRAALQDHPDLYEDKDRLKKIRAQAVSGARYRVSGNSKRPEFDISEREWNAIQAGAISHTALMKILQTADMDSVRDRATPKPKRGVSNAKVMRIRSLLSSGNYTQREIADMLGVSVSTVSKYA